MVHKVQLKTLKNSPYLETLPTHYSHSHRSGYNFLHPGIKVVQNGLLNHQISWLSSFFHLYLYLHELNTLLVQTLQTNHLPQSTLQHQKMRTRQYHIRLSVICSLFIRLKLGAIHFLGWLYLRRQYQNVIFQLYATGILLPCHQCMFCYIDRCHSSLYSTKVI